MTHHSRITAIVLLAGGFMPMSGAQAQWYGSAQQHPAPLYPYAVPNNRPYAVQVAPDTYVIQRPAAAPRVRSGRIAKPSPVKSADAARHRRGKVDPALIEELRQRPKVKAATIATARVGHERPIVTPTTRRIGDPRRAVGDDTARPHGVRAAKDDNGDGAIVFNRKGAGKGLSNGEKRVISADAEITILGPDRMSIRLFRKGSKANAQAD